MSGQDAVTTLTEDQLREGKAKLANELEEHQAELQHKFGALKFETPKDKSTASAPSSDTLLMNKFTIPEEFMPWFSQLEINNQTFTSELKRRLGELGQVESAMTPTKFVLSQGTRTLVEAEWVFLGTYHMMRIEDDDESAEAGVAPGEYYSWGWPWVIIEEAPEAHTLRDEVQKIAEIDERLKTGVALFRDGMIIRYIMAVLTEKMNFQHIYTSRSENTTSVFGFRNIVYGSLVDNTVQDLKKTD